MVALRRLLSFMRFQNTEEPIVPAPSTERFRILFVCLGNACRSQMAEGFARARYQDIFQAESAGITPLGEVPDETIASMAEIEVPMEGHTSKGIDRFDLRSFDIIVNMCGFPFPPSLRKAVRILDWEVEDPYTGSERVYRRVRNDIEKRMRTLVGDLRRNGLKD
jgi:arsenate reductase (thioredoxin)